MRLLLDILQAAGFGAATGLRPFLPALLVGVLARADLGVDFEDTAFAFLESSGFLLALVLALGVAVLVGRRSGEGERPLATALAGVGIVLGALLGAGSVDDHSTLWWPGLLAGAASAAFAGLAVRSLLERTRARLDRDARGALPLYVEAAAAIVVVACALLEPLALPVLALLGWLLLGARRRGREKYAGLRILR